jgi:hypothetical protein
MASILLIYIGCIIYLAKGTDFTRAMFCWRQRERKPYVVFPAKKAQDVCRAVVPAERNPNYRGNCTAAFICIEKNI